MIGKLATLVKSKTALAILGVVLVGGSGGAVAMAATTGHLSTLGVNLNTSDQNKSADASETPDSHAHTTSVEGLLKACDTTSAPNTITVTDRSGKDWTFAITSTTKFNGDTETESTSKGDNSANTGGASTGDHSGASTGDHSGASTGDHTGGASTGDHSGASTGASTGENSTHAAPTLADVCASANLNTRDVEVQATPNATDNTKYDAWKVTLQGPDSGKNDGESGSSTDHSAGGSTTGGSEGTPEAKPTGTPGD